MSRFVGLKHNTRHTPYVCTRVNIVLRYSSTLLVTLRKLTSPGFFRFAASTGIGLLAVNLTIFQHYYAQKPCPRRRSFEKARQVGFNIADPLSF